MILVAVVGAAVYCIVIVTSALILIIKILFKILFCLPFYWSRSRDRKRRMKYCNEILVAAGYPHAHKQRCR